MTDIESKFGAVRENNLAALINVMRLEIRELRQRVAKLESQTDPPKLHGVDEIVVDIACDEEGWWVYTNSSGFAKACETRWVAVSDVVHKIEQRWRVLRVSVTPIGGKTKGRIDLIRSDESWTDGVECHRGLATAIAELMRRSDPSNYRLTFYVHSLMGPLRVGEL